MTEGAASGRALLDLARALAFVAHAGQDRKGTGEPYFAHVEAVATSVQGWRRKTIAYLHDVIEDTDISGTTLRTLGFPHDIVVAVVALTRGTEETYRDFIKRICAHPDPDVRPVKLADVRHNLKDLDLLPGDIAGKRRRYVLAEALLLEHEGGSE
jgi:(p)ppGpp synthase/HD superfamily hydrolase